MSNPHIPRGHHESLLLLKGLQSVAEFGPSRPAEAALQLRRQAGQLQQRLHRQTNRIAAGLGEGASTKQPFPAFCSASLSSNSKRKRKRWASHPLAELSEWSDSKHAHSSDNLPPPSPENDRHLLSEVNIKGVEGELLQVVQKSLGLKPNFAYTTKDVEREVQRVFHTGFFETVEPEATDTRDGIALVLKVTPNPVLKGIVASGADVLPARVLQQAFEGQQGRTLNSTAMTQAIGKIDEWYQDRGIFGQVTNVGMENGIAEVKLAEMVTGDVNLRYLHRETREVLDEGNTRPEIILQQLCTRKGQVYSTRQAKADIDAVYSMGLFEDVHILPQPAENSTVDHPRADVILNVVERKTAGLSAGGGISATAHAEGALPGFIGSCSYSQRNLFGSNQKLAASVEVGQVDSLYRISHTDPWVKGDPFRTSRAISIQNTRTSGLAIHGKAQDDGIQSGREGEEESEVTSSEGNVITSRQMAGVEWGRPLAIGWSGHMGVNYQRAKCINERGKTLLKDMYDQPLTFSRGPADTMMLALLRAVYSGRGDSQMVVSMEQALPLQRSWLNFNRLRVRADRTISLAPRLKLLASAKGGMIIGDMPPYEAFPIGGTNSVRGYSEGGTGTGRNYVAGTAELHV
ncbi:hypothetical protein WJX84_004133, partial [Apatococcus fuscideae]